MRAAASSFYLAVFALLTPRPAHSFCVAAAASPPNANPDEPVVCAIDSKTIVSDACASFSTLDGLNSDLQPTIRALTQHSDFFSYYRLNLYNKECPFWSDDNGLCGNSACAVQTIENEEDIPLVWRAAELGKLQGPQAEHPDRKAQLQRPVKPLQGQLGAHVGESCVVEYDDEGDARDYCVPEDEDTTSRGDYVSLVDNPERFTGYGGPSAHQVWEAIYRENCFSKPKPPALAPRNLFANLTGPQGRAHEALRNIVAVEFDDECLEKRVFHRLMSGMHASVSTHLCYDYLNQTTGQWGPNVQCYQNRLESHPERISNLYFNYALVLRAVAKVRSALETYTFCSGDPVQDKVTKAAVLDLADKIAAGPNIYDESLMFQDSSTAGLKDDFRNRFRNVSRTMDCVGCDKCRLWGKVQVAGYGTALKILFEYDEEDESKNLPLRRTELVALINTLDKLSSSLSALEHFRDLSHGTIELIPEERSNDEKADKLVQDNDGSSAAYEPMTSHTGQGQAHSEAPTLAEAFNSEFDLIWRVFKWVVSSWITLPKHALQLAFYELNRLWQYWIGLPVQPSPWEWHWPTRDEI